MHHRLFKFLSGPRRATVAPPAARPAAPAPADPAPEPAASPAEAEASRLSLELAAGFFLAVVSQIYLLRNPEAWAWPVLGYGAAAALLLRVGRQLSQPAAPPAFWAVPWPARPSGRALLATSLALNLYAVLRVDRELSRAGDYALAAAWLLSLGVYAASVLALAGWRWPGWAALRAQARANRREVAAVAALFGLALALRTYDLPWHPYAFVNDEGEVGRGALQVLDGTRSNFFETGWSSQPIWSFVPTALSVSVFGNMAFAVRLVSAVQGSLAVVFTYLLGREAFGRRVGVLAAVLLLGLPWHLHFSRLGFNNIIDSFFASGVLWLAYRALRRGHLADYLWAGLAAGLTLYSYLGSRLALVLALGLLAHAILGRRVLLRTHVRHLLVFAGAAALTAAPMLTYFAQHPDQFTSRLNGENILINGWLQREAAATLSSPAEVLLEQFTRSWRVFVAGSASGQFFHSPRPYLVPAAAVFFGLGLGVAAWRCRQPRYGVLVAWFLAVVVLGSTLTVGPPSNQRLIMAAPAAALLAALGLAELARLTQQTGMLGRPAAVVLCLVVAGVSSVQGAAFYFGGYRAGHYFENASDEVSYEAALQAAALSGDYQLYLLGEPRVYAVFGDFHFLAPQVPVTDFNEVSPFALMGLPRDRGALFVAIPERAADLRRIAEALPGGEWQEVQRRYQAPQILYYAYQLPPGAGQ